MGGGRGTLSPTWARLALWPAGPAAHFLLGLWACDRPPLAGLASCLVQYNMEARMDALPPSAYPSAGRESFWASMEPLAINSSVAQSFCAAYSGDPHLGSRRQPTFDWTFPLSPPKFRQLNASEF
jgi:hypothetical protein